MENKVTPQPHWSKEERIAFDMWIEGEQHSCSTFIDEISITAGYGKFYSDGSFEYPFPDELMFHVYGTYYWDEFIQKNKNN